jgi:hypothetical protein
MTQVMLDHLDNRWAGNKPCIFVANSGYYGQITMQNCMNYEPHAMHPVGPSAYCNTLAICELCHNLDYHHNYFVNTNHRISEYTHSPMRWINNRIHNVGLYASLALGATQSDYIGNHYSTANMKPGYKKPIYSTRGAVQFNTLPGNPSFYLSDNIGYGDTTPAADQFGVLAGQAQDENVVNDLGPFPDAWKRSTPLSSSTPFAITVESSLVFEGNLKGHIGNQAHLDLNGNWVNHRDSTGIRIVQQVATLGDGAFWPGVTVAGPPSIPPPPPEYIDVPPVSGTPYPSSQHDGLSDAWKQAMGLDTTKPMNNHVMPDGYTALEWFLAGRKS